jgi:hypothetical protein
MNKKHKHEINTQLDISKHAIEMQDRKGILVSKFQELGKIGSVDEALEIVNRCLLIIIRIVSS